MLAIGRAEMEADKKPEKPLSEWTDEELEQGHAN